MKVLISGAGIAGTATAFWLRSYGFEPAVVERAPAIRDGGYKVDIRGAAVDTVARMGILDPVRANATGMRTATQYDAAGKVLAVLDAELFGGRHPGDVEIMRGDLNRLLHDQTRGDVDTSSASPSPRSGTPGPVSACASPAARSAPSTCWSAPTACTP